jgi:hypothetical protein
LELVGRGEDCEVGLASTQVSLYHCVLLRESNRLWCIDLASGNGTFLNGQKIECAPIEMGGRLQIGDFELEFQRYSRRSASASSLGDAAGSQLRLGPMSVGKEMPDENIARGSGIGAQASDSIFGNRIITNSADVVFQALSADDVEQLATKREEQLSLHANMRDGLAALTHEQARLRSDHEALARQLSQRLDEQRAALLEQLKQQAATDRQTLEDLAKAQAAQVLAQASAQRQILADELLQRVEELAKSQAQELKLQFDTQRLAATQELTRRLEAALESQSPQTSAASDPTQQVVAPQWLQRLDDLRSAQSEEIALAVATQGHALSQEFVQRLEDMHQVQGQKLNGQFDQQRQALAEELERRLETQQAELSRELLAQMESQRMALLQEQRAAQDALTERLQPLLATLDQLVSRQSQWVSQLVRQAEQIQATRQALAELQSRTDEHPVFQMSESEFNAPPAIVEDRPRETSLALLNDDATESIESTRGSEIALRPPITLTANAPMDSAAVGRKADTPLPEDDHLLHFVSDRLAEMDSGRQRWMLIYWALALGFVGIVGGVTWALWSWLSNQPAAS